MMFALWICFLAVAIGGTADMENAVVDREIYRERLEAMFEHMAGGEKPYVWDADASRWGGSPGLPGIDHPDEFGKTLLMSAARDGSLACVDFALKNGADATRMDDEGRSALGHAVSGSYPHSAAIVKLLVENGGLPTKGDHQAVMRAMNGTALLIDAARKGRTSDVRALLEEGVDMHGADQLGRTPLMHAAFGDAKDAMLALLEKGADANRVDNRGMSAFAYAVMGRSKTAAGLLMAMGGGPNAKDLESSVITRRTDTATPEKRGA